MLKRHGHVDDLRAINQAGARIAREAFDGREGFVLGDLGPLGAILEPYGDLPMPTRQAAYEEQARALVEAAWMRSSSRRRRRWKNWAWRLTRPRRRARRASSPRSPTICRRTKHFM